MIVKLKPGVSLKGLTPQMAVGLQIVASVYDMHGALECVVTGANDGKHMPKSKHYEGNALDFRTKDFHGSKMMLVSDVELALGRDFDVVLEAVGQDNEHLHVEYDPKG